MGEFKLMQLVVLDMSSDSKTTTILVVEHEYDKQMHIRFCLSVHIREPLPGPLIGFQELLIGEHITPTINLNIIKCTSGNFVGLQNATIQVSICYKKWSLFLPFYTLFSMEMIDWTELFSFAAAIRKWSV